MNRLMWILAIMGGAGLMATPCSAETWYVDSAAPGGGVGSEASPWNDLRGAVGAIGANDTLKIRGSFDIGGTPIPVGGDWAYENKILEWWDPGVRPVITGSGSALFEVSLDHATFRGLDMRQTNPNGWGVWDKFAEGPQMYEYNVYTGGKGLTSTEAHWGSGTQQVRTWMIGNIIHDTERGFYSGHEPSANPTYLGTIQNNVFYGISLNAIDFFNKGGALDSTLYITNNTFADIGGDAVHLAGGVGATLMANNLFLDVADHFYDGPDFGTKSNNAYYNSSGSVKWQVDGAEYADFVSWASAAADADSVAGLMPSFVDPAGGDFHLAAVWGNNFLVDAGADLSNLYGTPAEAPHIDVLLDLDGEPRPFPGGAYDIGAYEFQGALAPGGPDVIPEPTTLALLGLGGLAALIRRKR